jgi:hypothetical protein
VGVVLHLMRAHGAQLDALARATERAVGGAVGSALRTAVAVADAAASYQVRWLSSCRAC